MTESSSKSSSSEASLTRDGTSDKFNPFRPKRGRPPGPGPKQLPPKQALGSLARYAERALAVAAEDIDAYLPNSDDAAVAASILAGSLTAAEIAKTAEIPPARARDALTDPLRCAWIARQVHRLVATRIGLIDAALYSRAVAGDTRAAELLYKRYGSLQSLPAKHAHVHVHGGMDLTKMTDADLDAIFKSEQKANDRK